MKGYILVTRPAPQGEILCEKIRAAGGRAIYFPTIAIAPPQDLTLLQTQLAELNQADWVIFISPQAVSQSISYLPPLSPNLKVAAIGSSTAQALKKANITVDCYPEQDWTSEGLLALPEFAQVAGKKIVIIKGEGGRELLATTLEERGAKVIAIAAYRRVLPTVDTQSMADLLRIQKIDMIICTSNEGLQNLKILLETVWETLSTIPMLVISERMNEKAHQLGFKNVTIAKNASDAVLIDALAKEKNMTETTPTNSTRPVRKRPWVTIGIVFSTLGVVILILLFYLANFYYLNHFARTSTTQINTAKLQTDVETLEHQVLSLAEEVKSQAEVITALRQTQTGYTRDEWRIVEAEFLTKIANDKLQLENNIPQAITLLQSADAEVRNLNDAKFLPIRKALASDIAKLQATPQIDVPGLYLRLVAVNEQITKLPLPNKPVLNAEQSTQNDTHLPWWRRGLAQTWQALRQIVTVRYHEKGVLPLILPEQQDFLYQNLHAAIEKAMWGLLHRQPAIYRASLDQAMTWAQQYFVADSPVTKSVLETLEQLRAVDVAPSAPSLSDSLKAFQDYFSARGVSTETSSAAAH